MPMMPFIGVRISWLMLARKSLLARLAFSAASFCVLEFARPPLGAILEFGGQRHLAFAPGDASHQIEQARHQQGDAGDRERRHQRDRLPPARQHQFLGHHCTHDERVVLHHARHQTRFAAPPEVTRGSEVRTVPLVCRSTPTT